LLAVFHAHQIKFILPGFFLNSGITYMSDVTVKLTTMTRSSESRLWKRGVPREGQTSYCAPYRCIVFCICNESCS